MIKAGMLRNKVDWQRKTVSGVGDRGQPELIWSDQLTNVGADIEELTGRRLELARQINKEITHKVTMRKLILDQETDRLKWGDLYLYAKSVIDIGQRGRVTELLCQVGEA